MENFKRELRDLLTRYPQVESVTYKTAETITKDTFIPELKSEPVVGGVPPQIPPTVVSALEELKRVGMANKDKEL